MSHAPNPSNIHEVDHEPVPVKVYLGVFLGLLALTALTVGVSYIDFRGYDLHVAMVVALMKASLVVLYFMNLRQRGDRMNSMIFLTGVFFLIIFSIPTFWDYATRDKVDTTRGEYLQISREGYPPGVSKPLEEGAAAATD